MEKELYTIKEVAQILCASKSTIEKWVTAGIIKSVKIEKLRRIPKSEIERLLKGE